MRRGAGPRMGDFQAASPEQPGGIVTDAIPVGCGFFEFLTGEMTGSVLVDPGTQARPSSQQGFVGDLDGVLFLCEQPASRESVQHRRNSIRTGAFPQQILTCHGASGVVCVVADLHQPQEQGPRDLLTG